jgi:hypothetical protein
MMAEAADLILHRGLFTTLDRSNPTASAVAIKDGRFIAVGRDHEVMPLAGGSFLVLSGLYRWLGALGLFGFTLFASGLANQFWGVHGPQRIALENAFFEHIGLAGGFLLVAWHDLAAARASTPAPG